MLFLFSCLIVFESLPVSEQNPPLLFVRCLNPVVRRDPSTVALFG